MSDKRNWYEIVAKADGTAEIYIYDEIGGYGMSAKQFMAHWQTVKDAKAIKLRINSPGGSVFDAAAIYNNLKAARDRITIYVDGIAASAASFIAMVGNKIVMPKASWMMIHNPSGAVYGNAKDMRETADVLDKIRDGLVTAYENRTGKTADEIVAMLDSETWMTGEEALAAGFADETTDDQIKNLFDPAVFRGTVPDSYKALFAQDRNPAEPPEQEESGTEGETEMSDKVAEITSLDALTAAYPDLVSQIRDAAKAEGVKAEKDRYVAILALSDAPEAQAVIASAIKSDMDVATAKVVVEQVQSGLKAAKLQAGLDATTQTPVKPNAEDTAHKEQPKFMDLVKAYQDAHKGCTVTEATSACVDLYPEAHAAMYGRKPEGDK